MAPAHVQLATNEERNEASWEGLKGGLNGAVTWGFFTGLASVGLYFFSPVYRNLTVQFKVYLQMSGMITGSMIGAEARMREHEKLTRRMKKIRRDHEVWRRYEEDYEDEKNIDTKTINVRTRDVKGGASAGSKGNSRNSET